MDWTVLLPHIPRLMDGLLITLWVTVLGTLASVAGALLLAGAAASPFGPVRGIVRVYTEIILGLPILVLLYLIYFVAPDLGLRLDEISAGVLTLTLYYSPYMAEAIRGAVGSIPPGQIDAARMVGMPGLSIARRIVAPQVLGLVIPPLTGLMIGLAKDTAILSVISVQEFAYRTKQVVSRTYAPFEVWTFVAVVYWMLLSAFETLMRGAEGRALRFRESR
ncbi:amino acid ABC transporter permease [Chthonobacter albigriseus]|uniref:amino acid ABC transporter permease n=1 Tax=Chthonobacter albigriseus TaxID=1683161 RepID=UPI0015EFCBFA|nr:amino acid ABC transporter permease [Chthonobacter albigriseus]